MVIPIKNFIKTLFSLTNSEHKQKNEGDHQVTPDKLISNIIEENEKQLNKLFYNCFDITIRKINLFASSGPKCLLVYISELVDENQLQANIISKLNMSQNVILKNSNIENTIKHYLGIQDDNVFNEFNRCIDKILDGNVVLFLDTFNKAFSISLKSELDRTVSEPKAETVLRGPRDGFTESLPKNLAMLRGRVKNINLKTEMYTMGSETKTNFAIMYLSGTVDGKVLSELKTRLKKINLTAVVDTNYIVESIEDDTFDIFPLIFRTERPDVATMKLFEGRVLIIMDKTPVVLSVPSLFVEYIQSPEDYYMKYFFATLNRWVRYLSFIITAVLPGLYVALVTFHQELIPTSLSITIVNARTDIPLPAFFECLVLLITYEILREAGSRMPKQIGQTLSIVGTLIIGEAAIRAGIVSAPMIIVVAFAGTALFTIPSPEIYTALSIIRMCFLILGSLFGMLGIICCMLLLDIYLVSRRSFGIPYMYPICPFNFAKNRDTLLRTPLWQIDKKIKPL